MAISLPRTDGMSEQITLPANNAPPGAKIEVVVSNTLPPAVAQIPAKNSKPYMSFTLKTSTDVTLQGVPRFSVRLRSKPVNHGAYYAWRYSLQSGWRDVGPMTVSGKALTFGGSPRTIKLKANVAYAVVPFTARRSQACPTPRPLFVANINFTQGATGDVLEYAAPYTGKPITITKSSEFPTWVAFGPNGNLFVSYEYDGGYPPGDITEYAPPYTGTPVATITTGINLPVSLAFNASGNLFVSNTSGPVVEYKPPYTNASAPIATITNGVNSPYGLAFDGSDNLFVANLAPSLGNVTEYAPPYTGAPVATNTHGINQPHGLAFDASGNLFVANINTAVTEYKSPYTGAPIATVTNGVFGPVGLAFDSSGNLFVSNVGNTGLGPINEYASPYTGAPILTVTGPFPPILLGPWGLAFGP